MKIDPERIGALGDSAGGHLALLLGTLDPADGMEGKGGHADQPSKVQAVVNYYGLLPGDTDSAWNLLTTKFQNGRAGGRATYDAYWASIQSVSASNAQDTGNDKAEATITYVYKDGRTATERTEFRFKQQDGVLKIDDTSTKG